MATKLDAYMDLVRRRKLCRACQCIPDRARGLTNPAEFNGGLFDSDHIGPWSVWQGNLDAKVLIVGQDWGDVGYFEKYQGQDDAQNATNGKLVELLRVIGINVNCPPPFLGLQASVFLTNAILCLKQDGMQAQVRREWYDNCGPQFLGPLIEIIRPSIVITLGAWAYYALRKPYGLTAVSLRSAVAAASGYQLSNGATLFPMYHCGRRVLNTVRRVQQQEDDWRRINLAQTQGAFSAPACPAH